MSSGPFPASLSLWGPVLLSALGLGFAVFGLIKPRSLAGLFAMLLATLTAGAGVIGQVRAEREIERFITTDPSPPNRAAVERGRMYRYFHAQSLGRKVALAAVLPLLLGAVAALRRPLGGRVLPMGFLGLGVIACGAAWHISHRPLPVDRYEFAEDDDDIWMLAIAIDGAVDTTARLGDLGSDCDGLDATVRHYRRSAPVPPTLDAALRLAARGCVQRTLAALETEQDPTAARTLRRSLVGSALLEDEAVRERLARPPSRSEASRVEARLRARERLRELFGPGSIGALEEVLARRDAGVP